MILHLSFRRDAVGMTSLKWDGSLLGTIPPEKFTFVASTPWTRYYRVEIGDLHFYSAARRIADAMPAILDEIKPLFGLIKIGTHQIIVKSSRYLLLRTRMRGNTLIEDAPLSCVDCLKPSLKEKIREVLVFREVAGISTTWERHIRISPNNLGEKMPLSYDDGRITSGGNVLTTKMLRKWFGENTIEEVLQKMLSTSSRTSMTTIFFLRSALERIVTRIEPRMIWYVSIIIERVANRLHTAPGF